MTSPSQFHVDFLKGVIASGGDIVAARFSLRRELLKHIDPVYILTLEQHGIRSLQELAWGPELETYLLLERPTRTASHEEESERFAAILLNNLETAESRHGKGFARSVFILLLRERTEYKLADRIASLPVHLPNKNSGPYSSCRSFLQHSLDGLQNTAQALLKYPHDISLSLLSNSIVIVLDETFHVSARRVLFPSADSAGNDTRRELVPPKRDELRLKLLSLSSLLFTSSRDNAWWRRRFEAEIPDIVESLDAWTAARPDSTELRKNVLTLKARLGRASQSTNKGVPIGVEHTQAIAEALNDVVGALMRLDL